MICSGYNVVDMIEDCYSEGRGFETVTGTLSFLDIRISNQHNFVCCSRALSPARVNLFCSGVGLMDDKL